MSAQSPPQWFDHLFSSDVGCSDYSSGPACRDSIDARTDCEAGWAAQKEFIEDALSPAQVIKVELKDADEAAHDGRQRAVVEVLPEQQSLAIGRGGQNVRLAAKLTGWKIDIVSAQGDVLASDATPETPKIDAPEVKISGKENSTVLN